MDFAKSGFRETIRGISSSESSTSRVSGARWIFATIHVHFLSLNDALRLHCAPGRQEALGAGRAAYAARPRLGSAIRAESRASPRRPIRSALNSGRVHTHTAILDFQSWYSKNRKRGVGIKKQVLHLLLVENQVVVWNPLFL